ncbi:MAG: FISUMP domain-containing protein [Salinivirgaceae bacterium]
MKKISQFIIYFLLIFIFSLCQDEDLINPSNESPDKISISIVTSSNITYRQFEATAYIHLNSTLQANSYGICYSTTQNPTLSDSISFVSTLKNDSIINVVIEHLSPNTTYYLKAFVKIGETIIYSNENNVQTIDVQEPTLGGIILQDKTSISFSIKCEVIAENGESLTERGICWSKNENPTIENNVIKDDSLALGEFYISATDLYPNNNYFVKAYAKNAKGTAYSNNQLQITTNDVQIEVNLNTISEITPIGATFSAEILSNGGHEILERGFCLDTSGTPTIDKLKKQVPGTDNLYSKIFTELKNNTTYYIRAYAINKYDTAYSQENNFTTLDGIPIVTTNSWNDLTSTSVNICGDITEDYNFPILEKGICYGQNTNPTIDNAHSINNEDENSFCTTLTDLEPETSYYARVYAKNQFGVGYGANINFTTITGLPFIDTKDITEITISSAKSGGVNVVDNGFSITSKGICWATTQNPVIDDNPNITNDGTGTEEFISIMDNLEIGTRYYVRAYASNENGTSYGTEKTFQTKNGIPVLTTTTPTNETSSSVETGGTITDNGGYAITQRGICWATTENPNITNDHTSDGTGTGIFTITITGLMPETTYYIRAYATNQFTTAYGQQETFTTTSNLPNVTTAVITNNTTGTTATSGGNVTSDNGFTVTARGVCWSINQNPTTSNSYTIDGAGTGTYTSSLTGLSPNTTYYVRAYATNANGTNYGNEVSFTTPVILPTVTTTAISAINAYGATSGGNVTSNGGATVTARGICWSTNSNPTISDNVTTDGTGNGTFTSTLTGLNPETTYYVRAYATNSLGTGYGDNIDFKTTQVLTPSINSVLSILIHDGGGGGVGNEDEMINVNEEIDLDIEIKNNGNGNALNITGTLSFDGTNDAGLTWDQDVVTMSSLAAGTSNDFDDYDFTITGMPSDGKLDFKLVVTYEDEYGNTYSNTFTGGVLDIPVYEGNSGTFTDSRDNQTYNWIKIGNDIWMAENLNYAMSGAIGVSPTSVYGWLYNYSAAVNACPTGWSLPSSGDLDRLITNLGGVEIAGGKMKTTGTTYWISPNSGATNESGFSALPSGTYTTTITERGQYANFWVDYEFSDETILFLMISHYYTSNYQT